MKFTYEDLAKAMGLKVGDRIKWGNYIYTIDSEFYLFNENTKVKVSLSLLVDKVFEILPLKKKIGELKCKDFKSCIGCPLKCVLCMSVIESSKEKLYDILEKFNAKYHDQEIYDIIKKRLDKEVEENEM